MFYAFSMDIAAGNLETNKKIIKMPLSPGVIHQVDVLFQSGCAHKQHIQIFDANLQLWPYNRDENIRGDATVVSFREFYELFPENNTLIAVAWTDDADVIFDVVVQIGVLPRAILQPFSLAQLLRALRKS